MTFPDTGKLRQRVSFLTEALWNRQQKLLAIDSGLMYLEFAREHRLLGQRSATALYLDRANTRYKEAVSHYITQARLEGKNENT